MPGRQIRILVYVLCIASFFAHAALSVHAQAIKAHWPNVPPVPDGRAAGMMALGDNQFAYRTVGVMIQNLGDTGGDTTPLYKYDYDRLAAWFRLEDSLDTRSNFIPMLAAYYFGGTQKPEQLDPVIDYLADIGQRPYGEKWRWLAQAVYLARFPQHDLQKAARLADLLAASWRPGMPVWVRAMPALVASQEGDKQAAYDLMIGILKSDSEKMHPNEVNFMIDYICTRLLEKEAAAQHPLCKLLK